MTEFMGKVCFVFFLITLLSLCILGAVQVIIGDAVDLGPVGLTLTIFTLLFAFMSTFSESR